MKFVDARCGCEACTDRTGNMYRMIGRCSNCHAEPILILYRAGDVARRVDCPVCGNFNSIRPDRLAEPDEIPTPEETHDD